jgi:hypothetical protein
MTATTPRKSNLRSKPDAPAVSIFAALNRPAASAARALSDAAYDACGMRKVNVVCSGDDVAAKVPPCACAISEAM